MSDDIVTELQSLKNEIAALRTFQNNRDRQDYDRIKAAIEDSLVHSVQIENDLTEVTKQIKATELFNLLMLVNNGESGVLGFKFTEVVNKKALEVLTKDITNEKAKNRFSDILKKVIDNPIASTLIDSNPVAGVISNVANFASNFIDTITTGGGLSMAKSVTKDVINLERIKEFNEALEKHVALYSSLNVASNKLNFNIDSLKGISKGLNASIIGTHQQLRSKLSLPPNGGYSSELQQRFNVLNDDFGYPDFTKLIKDTEIISAYNISLFIASQESTVTQLVDDYSKNFKDFLEEYKDILSQAKVSVEGIDHNLVEQIIEKINHFENDMFETYKDKILLRNLKKAKLLTEKNIFN